MSLLFALGLVFLPSLSFAAPADAELKTYLDEIGWTQTDLEEYLDFYDLALADFEDMEDLSEFLGAVLTDETLSDLLQEYELTLEEATQLLIENGELEEGQSILDVYTFYDDLDIDLFYYNLTPITDENLQQLLDFYDLTIEELHELLAEHDDSLDYYEHIEDLEWAIEYYLYYEEEEIDFSEIDDLFNELGLTSAELETLFDHFLTLDVEDPAFLDKLDELSARMMAFEDFDAATELTAEQIADLLDIFSQFIQLFEMDVKFYLVQGDEKKDITLTSLMAMPHSNGADLLIELYNKQGAFLADIIFTAKMLGSEIIAETGKDIKKAEEVIVEKTTAKKPDRKLDSKPVIKTQKGAKLPKTASDYVANTAVGLAVALAGFAIYRRFKVKNA
jgi:processed acidic surface protein